MAHKSSTNITNRDAGVLTTAAGGAVLQSEGFISVTASEGTSDILRFTQIPSNARGVRVFLSNSSSGGTGALNIGLHNTVPNGGTVVDADLFGSAVAITSAQNSLAVHNESGEYALTEAEMPLWQALGLTADPRTVYDVTAMPTAAVASTASVVLHVQYKI